MPIDVRVADVIVLLGDELDPDLIELMLEDREGDRDVVLEPDAPLLAVQPDELFEVETYDAATGYFKSSEDKAIPALRPGFDRSPPLVNPIAGPISVAGAERGDTLEVAIESIAVDDHSWIATGPTKIGFEDGRACDRSMRTRRSSAIAHLLYSRGIPGFVPGE